MSDLKSSSRHHGDSKKESELEYYLKLGYPTLKVVQLFKQQGKSKNEIDKFVEKYSESRKKLAKHITNFWEKVRNKPTYASLDLPELIEKGLKHAQKNKFNEAEIKAFISYVKNGDIDKAYDPFGEEYSKMKQFFGLVQPEYTALDTNKEDEAPMHKIYDLFKANDKLHSIIRGTLANYKSCSSKLREKEFDNTKQNPYSAIHPVVFALFYPKIHAIDNIMLRSNIGRIVVNRVPLLQIKHSTNHMARKCPLDEKKADELLVNSISNDPNSLSYFQNDSPMANLLKRFKIQIALWKNVMELRRGNVYSSGSVTTTTDLSKDDNISGFLNALNAYDWNYFDSPEYYRVQDDGTILRKLLAVFSVRPTLVAIVPKNTDENLLTQGEATYFNIPIINVRLPTSYLWEQNKVRQMVGVSLQDSLRATDYRIDNIRATQKYYQIVEKTKSVIYSQSLIFFYVNRTFVELKRTGLGNNFSVISEDPDISMNKSPVRYDLTMGLGSSNSNSYHLRSVVGTIQDDSGNPSGSIALCVKHPEEDSTTTSQIFYAYDPLAPLSENIKYPVNQISQSLQTTGSEELTFDWVRTNGTIFIYSVLNETE